MTIAVERVTFTSEGARLVGDLHVPAGDERGGLPAVVVAGSWTTVRGQMPAVYARELAARGFLALSFDFRGYGGSGGEPRDVEDPGWKAVDIGNAVGFLAAHPRAAADRIGALGVCAGGGYMAVNAVRDDRVRSLALVAPWVHDAGITRELYGDEGVARRIEVGERAFARWRETGVVDYVPAVSTIDPDAAMHGPFEYYLDPARGAIPEWGNRFAVMAWPRWLRFDPIAVAPAVRVPTLLVHSEDAAIPDGARRFHAALGGEKRFVWTTGGQFDFYDHPATVATAIDAAVEHFSTTF